MRGVFALATPFEGSGDFGVRCVLPERSWSRRLPVHQKPFSAKSPSNRVLASTSDRGASVSELDPRARVDEDFSGGLPGVMRSPVLFASRIVINDVLRVAQPVKQPAM
jgi:hypothetical protein